MDKISESQHAKYWQLQTILFKEYKRWRALIISIILGVLLSAIGAVACITLHQSFEDAVPIISSLFLIGVMIPLLVLIGWHNMVQSGFEEQFIIGIGKDYFRKNRIKLWEVQLIDKRAEIGSGALSSRTIIGIIVVTLIISIINKNLPASIGFTLMILLLFVSFLYLIELDRANMDVIIRQLCQNYIYELKNKLKRKRK